MKKILFASTAVVAFAGAASADIALTGFAEMGIQDSNAANVDVGFFTDINVTFTMSGETDNGLTFGAKVELDDGAAAFAPATQGGESIFISGAFGTLTMGDTDGALDWAMQEVLFNAGSIGSNEEHGAYLGSYLDGSHDGQIARYDYSFGDFAFAISAELNDFNTASAAAANAADDNVAIGVKYGLDLGGTALNFGLGYQKTGVSRLPATGFLNTWFAGAVVGDEVEAVGISVNTTLANGLSAGIAYTDFDHSLATGADNGLDGDHIGVGVGYKTGAISLSANYGKFDSVNNANDRDGYGFSVGYDLGGGASVQFGYGQEEIGAAAKTSDWSLGVRMNF